MTEIFDFQIRIGRKPSGEPFFAIEKDDSKKDQNDPNCWFLNENNANKLFDHKEKILSIMRRSMVLQIHSKVDQKDLSPKELKKQIEDRNSKLKKVQKQQQKLIAKMSEDEKYCHKCCRKSWR